MGVPGLHTWLRRQMPDAFVPFPEASFACDHLYIDMSSTLHQVIRRARTKQYFHLLLHRRLDEILAAARPQQRVVLALDGPAPLAKLLEQRRRRRRELDKAQRATEAAEAAAAAAAESSAEAQGSSLDGGSPGSPSSRLIPTVEALALAQFRPPNPELSTLALTTGSLLMLEVHSSLAAYICKKLSDPATAHLRFELSDSTVKGEGELKILSRLLHPNTNSQAGPSSSVGNREQQEQQPGETHLVLGADSDLLLMALVAGQRGVFILPDLPDDGHHHRQRRRHHRSSRYWLRNQPTSGSPEAAGSGSAVEVASTPLPLDSSISSGSESSGSEAESDPSGPESEGEEEEEEANGGTAALSGTVAAAAAAPPLSPPLLMFSRDAAEQLWRDRHLGAGSDQQEVTALALDLMLLAVMCSGDDYLPAIQGMQLSNKHRPGLWDLYTSMRQQPEWRGQSLVLRNWDCGGGKRGSRSGPNCPTVRLNPGMLAALLAEYYRQRFVYMEAPNAAAVAASSIVEPTRDGAASTSNSGAAMVWDREGLAAAAAMADMNSTGGSLPAAGGRRRPSITMRGMEGQPEAYVQGVEWVLGMYCSGAVQDYRFTYDLPAPSLTQLLHMLHTKHQGPQAPGSDSPKVVTSAASSTDTELAGGQASADMQQAGASSQAPGQPMRRSLQPLLPAACAMALLPRGGRIHAATALRHLMDEGSELEDIYATCDTCVQLGQQMGIMNRELDGARSGLVEAQLRLTTAAAEGAGQAGAATAVAVLQAEVERRDAEVARLKVLLSHLSRSQQEHLSEQHPYKPFPTDQLEAAVAAVPLEDYPRRERKLAHFGREFVYSRKAPPTTGSAATGDEAGAGGGLWRRHHRWTSARRREVVAAAAPPGTSASMGSGSGEEESGAESEEDAQVLGQLDEVGTAMLVPKPQRVQGLQPRGASAKQPRAWPPLQPWLEECLSFAALYPRVADPFLIRRSNWTLQRSVLPLRPYMQPPRLQCSPDGNVKRPLAVLSPCQLLQWSQPRRPRRTSDTGLLARRQTKAQLQQGQRAQVHTLRFGSRTGGRGQARAQLSPGVTLLQGCSRLLHTLPRVLRAF